MIIFWGAYFKLFFWSISVLTCQCPELEFSFLINYILPKVARGIQNFRYFLIALCPFLRWACLVRVSVMLVIQKAPLEAPRLVLNSWSSLRQPRLWPSLRPSTHKVDRPMLFLLPGIPAPLHWGNTVRVPTWFELLLWLFSPLWSLIFFYFFFLCAVRYKTSNRACAQSLHQTAALPAHLHFLLHDGCLLAEQSHAHFYHLSSAPSVHPVIFTAPGHHHPCLQALGTCPRSAELFQPSRPAGVQPPPPAAAQTQTAEEEGFHHHQGHDSAVLSGLS